MKRQKDAEADVPETYFLVFPLGDETMPEVTLEFSGDSGPPSRTQVVEALQALIAELRGGGVSERWPYSS